MLSLFILMKILRKLVAELFEHYVHGKPEFPSSLELGLFFIDFFFLPPLWPVSLILKHMLSWSPGLYHDDVMLSLLLASGMVLMMLLWISFPWGKRASPLKENSWLVHLLYKSPQSNRYKIVVKTGQRNYDSTAIWLQVCDSNPTDWWFLLASVIKFL